MQKQQPQHFTLARAQNATQIMLDSTVGCELRKLTLFILNGWFVNSIACPCDFLLQNSIPNDQPTQKPPNRQRLCGIVFVSFDLDCQWNREINQ